MRRLASWAPVGIVFLHMTCVFGLIRATSGGLVERDGYYHARVAAMFPGRALSRSFPWRQADPARERFFDRELLYHALMWPFARGEEPARGAAVFAALLSAAVFAGFYVFLRLSGVRSAWLATGLLACMGSPFLMRVSFMDSHVLSVLLFTGGLYFLVAGSWRGLLLTGVLCSWSHAFSFMLPAAAAVFVLGRWTGAGPAGEGKAPGLDWRLPAAALAGVLLGLAAHPQAPHPLMALWSDAHVLGEAFGHKSLAAVQATRDYARYTPRDLFHAYPLVTALVLASGFATWRGERRLSAEGRGMMAAAAFAFLLTLGFQRYIEYAAPLSAAAFAFLWRDALDELTTAKLRAWASETPWARLRVGACALLTIAGLQLLLLSPVASALRRLPPPRFEGASAWMAANLRPGETVVNLWWSDFPELFYHGHRQRFAVGLDPSYMHRGDARAERLELMSVGAEPIDAAWLAESFKARALVLRAGYVRLYPELSEGDWKPVYADRHAAVFSLR